MTTIATLAVNVVSNTGGMTKGLDKARQSMKQTGSSSSAMGGMLSRINPTMIAVGAAAAGAALAVAKVGEAMKRLDDIGKRSTSLGIMPQQLMAFNNASVLGGVGADKMSKALQKMQRGVGEASLGVGTLKVALDDMNIDVNEFKHLSPDEQFKVFADSIASIENPAERAAHATNIFGKAGADLIPMLAGGRAGLEAVEAETLKLQGTMDKMDITAVEDNNDAWAKLGMALDGVWNQLAVAVAPALEMVANVLTEIMSVVVGIVDAWNDFWKTDAEKGLEERQKALEQHEAMVAKAAEAEAEAARVAAEATEKLTQQGEKLTESLRTPLEKFEDSIAEFDELLAAGAITWETYERAVKKATDELKRSEDFKKKEIKALERQAIGAQRRGEAGTISLQRKQARTLEAQLEQQRLQLKEEQEQTALLQNIKNNISSPHIVNL